MTITKNVLLTLKFDPALQTWADRLLDIIENKTELEALRQQLKTAMDPLAAAVAQSQGVKPMAKATASPVLQQLADQVAATTGVEASAVAFINGFAQRLADAVAAALAGGATAAELQPITDEVAAMKASADALSAAIVANP